MTETQPGQVRLETGGHVAVPIFRQQQWGRIINLGSISWMLKNGARKI